MRGANTFPTTPMGVHIALHWPGCFGVVGPACGLGTLGTHTPFRRSPPPLLLSQALLQRMWTHTHPAAHRAHTLTWPTVDT